jgi:hypothetical protein
MQTIFLWRNHISHAILMWYEHRRDEWAIPSLIFCKELLT